MTPRQMLRAMRKWGISILFDESINSWYAGRMVEFQKYSGVAATHAASLECARAGSVHVGGTPEIAVEDYCNARNLEWDV